MEEAAERGRVNPVAVVIEFHISEPFAAGEEEAVVVRGGCSWGVSGVEDGDVAEDIIAVAFDDGATCVGEHDDGAKAVVVVVGGGAAGGDGGGTFQHEKL